MPRKHCAAAATVRLASLGRRGDVSICTDAKGRSVQARRANAIHGVILVRRVAHGAQHRRSRRQGGSCACWLEARGLTIKVTGAPRRCSRERRHVPARPVHRLVRPHTTSFRRSPRRSQDERPDAWRRPLQTAPAPYRRGYCTKHGPAPTHDKNVASPRTENTRKCAPSARCALNTDAVQPPYACHGRSAGARRANATHGVMVVL